MGAAASLQEAAESDLPELVPRSQAETLLGTTLEHHNEWRLHADAQDRVPRATLRSGMPPGPPTTRCARPPSASVNTSRKRWPRPTPLEPRALASC